MVHTEKVNTKQTKKKKSWTQQTCDHGSPASVSGAVCWAQGSRHMIHVVRILSLHFHEPQAWFSMLVGIHCAKITSPFFKKRLCTYTCDQPVWGCVCVCVYVYICACMWVYAYICMTKWMDKWSFLYLHEADLIYEDLRLQKSFPFFHHAPSHWNITLFCV